MKQPINTSSAHITFFLLLALLSGCGYQAGMDHGLTDFDHVRDPGSSGQTIAIPLFENATFEPLLEKRISQIFKETFIARGWEVRSDPGRADLVLEGRISRYHRAPVSLNPQGQAREYRIQIGLKVHLQQSGEKRFETSPETSYEESAEYLARADAKASRSAEDRAIREVGRKMAEKLADLLLTRITPEKGQNTDQ
jgi:outer membrane lipopolysaccharide assembly protein LptE/RlpB